MKFFNNVATDGFAITPDDNNDLPQDAVVYVGVTGDLNVVTIYGNQVLYSNVAQGFHHPVAVKRVLATGTTATNLVGSTVENI